MVETALENGLQVLVQESHTAPVVSCWVGYRVGSRNERPGITGASHWVEHMTFKTTDGLPSGEIFRLTARHGGSNNGFTSDDYTLYYETLPADQLEVALQIESERMASVLFDPAETEKERGVILAERQGNENSPLYRLGEQLRAETFRGRSYAHPIIGTEDDLRRITRDDLREHYRTYYAPNNAVLVISGDVDAEAVLPRVQRVFGEIPPAELPAPAAPAEPPPAAGSSRIELRERGSAAYLQLLYPTPAAGHPDCYPLAMADALLSGARPVSWNGGGYMGRTARLYRRLVESHLAINVGSAFRFSTDPYAFSASLTLREGRDPAEAEAVLAEVVEGLATEPPSEEELARLRCQAEAQFAYSRDGVTSRAFALLHFHLLGHWSNLDHHLERLQAVTPEEIARVAARYLTPENRTTGWFLPEAA
ncbi:MAG: M16 family metallopeptidase [Armatimonadota bacterium]